MYTVLAHHRPNLILEGRMYVVNERFSLFTGLSRSNRCGYFCRIVDFWAVTPNENARAKGAGEAVRC